MILDVNVLIYGIDSRASQHPACKAWLESAFGGTTRVGLPWPTITGFLRIVTHPRIMESPLTMEQAWAYVNDWLAVPVSWIPEPTADHARVLQSMTTGTAATGNLVPDAHLAALGRQHGVAVVSCDTDFARFTDVAWINPSAV